MDEPQNQRERRIRLEVRTITTSYYAALAHGDGAGARQRAVELLEALSARVGNDDELRALVVRARRDIAEEAAGWRGDERWPGTGSRVSG